MRAAHPSLPQLFLPGFFQILQFHASQGLDSMYDKIELRRQHETIRKKTRSAIHTFHGNLPHWFLPDIFNLHQSPVDLFLWK